MSTPNSLIHWKAIGKHDEMLKVLRNLRSKVQRRIRERKDLTYKMYAECMLNIVVFRRMLYSEKPTEDGKRVFLAIKRLRAHIGKATITLKYDLPSFTTLAKMKRFSKSKISLPRNHKTIIAIMDYDRIQRGLEELRRPEATVPDAVGTINTIASTLGFENVLVMIEYVKSPVVMQDPDFDVKTYIEAKKKQIIEANVITADGASIAREFSRVLIDSIQSKQHEAVLGSMNANFTIDLPVIYDFDFDSELLKYEPLNCDAPPDPSPVYAELDTLQTLRQAVEGGDKAKAKELNAAYKKAVLSTRGFVEVFLAYFEPVVNAAAKKRKAEEILISEYSAWKRQTIETIDNSYNEIAVTINKVTPELIKLAAACGIAARAGDLIPSTQQAFIAFFRVHSSTDVGALWAKVMETAGQRGSIKNVLSMMQYQLMSD